MATIRLECKDYGGVEIWDDRDPDSPVYLAPHLLAVYLDGDVLNSDGEEFVSSVVTERLKSREVDSCVAHTFAQNNPLTFVWKYQTQADGLLLAMRHMLSLSTSELLPIAPLIATFRADLFSQMAGISQERATGIIAWAQAAAQVDQAAQQLKGA